MAKGAGEHVFLLLFSASLRSLITYPNKQFTRMRARGRVGAHCLLRLLPRLRAGLLALARAEWQAASGSALLLNMSGTGWRNDAIDMNGDGPTGCVPTACMPPPQINGAPGHIALASGNASTWRLNEKK